MKNHGATNDTICFSIKPKRLVSKETVGCVDGGVKHESIVSSTDLISPLAFIKKFKANVSSTGPVSERIGSALT